MSVLCLFVSTDITLTTSVYSKYAIPIGGFGQISVACIHVAKNKDVNPNIRLTFERVNPNA